MIDYPDQINRLLKKYPSSIKEHLEFILQNSGRLDPEHCAVVMKTLGCSVEDLMVKLLPVAELYVKAPISNFSVGAVARARMSEGSDDFALFMGANIEFAELDLTQTIHAEQAAVMNAWLQAALKIDAVAVSAFPCGRCRQFLYELDGSHSVVIVVQKRSVAEAAITKLTDLLPQAFGPADLGVSGGLMATPGQLPDLSLKTLSDDPMVIEALSAAGQSHAPYTRNFAGVALQLSDDKIYIGRYAENAGYNPSLSPLHTAIIRMNADHFSCSNPITRAVLVEAPTMISQRGVCELLLSVLAPDVQLEYFEAE